MAKISIITPFFNSEKYIEECIKSVLNQSFQDFEFILINDGSSDNSLNIANEYAKNDERIMILSEKNSGQGVARNMALKKATGEIILYLDSDDSLVSDALFEIDNKFKKDNPDFIIFNAYNFIQSTKECNENCYSQPFFKKFKENVFSSNDAEENLFEISGLPLKAYRKDFLIKNDIKYSETRFIEDSEFSIKALICGKRISCLDKFLVNYRIHKNATTFTQNSDVKTVEKTFYVCENILKNSAFKDNEKAINSFLINRTDQLLYYLSLNEKKDYKSFYNTTKNILKYINKKYGFNYYKKNKNYKLAKNILHTKYGFYIFKQKLIKMSRISK